jgi:hypothetical protein
VVLLEADRTGGSLAGWLDTPPTPSLTTLVAARGPRIDSRSSAAIPSDIRHETPPPPQGADFEWDDIAHAVQSSASGVRFIAAPVRSREAALAIAEAERSLIPMLGELDTPTVVADIGMHTGADPLPASVLAATTTVVLHRQDPSSAGAESVRLARLVEVMEQLAPIQGRIVLGVIGEQPFDVAEIADHIALHIATRLAHTYAIAFDPLSASVLAGRAGVSAKRLARLPLARSIAPLANDLLADRQRLDGRRLEVLR